MVQLQLHPASFKGQRPKPPAPELGLKKGKASFANTDIPSYFYTALPNCGQVNISYAIWKAKGHKDTDPRAYFRDMKLQHMQSMGKKSQ